MKRFDDTETLTSGKDVFCNFKDLKDAPVALTERIHLISVTEGLALDHEEQERNPDSIHALLGEFQLMGTQCADRGLTAA